MILGFRTPPTLSHFWKVLASLSSYRVDRNLTLYLPRLTVLVSIEADRPGAWFPGPLDPYQAWSPAIYLSRDFDLVKVPGNPMKSPFGFGVFLG